VHEINSQNIPSPHSFIGEEYGKQFTPHHRLVSYFQEVSSDSRVELQKYGETNEGRPLYLAIVTSEENHKNLEEIRKKNLSLAQMANSTLSDNEALPIVWLSYSVHGNEAGGSESSMTVLYKLLTDTNIKNLLDEVVVIIDPSLNPDGYSRYSHWFRGNSGKELHPSHTDVEHMEPWPGGRVNHYLFDLNRDWAWQTQVETQQRIKQYNKWMPHVHADLHEMGYDDHYFFAPAAEPFHEAITDYQRALQQEIGQSNADVFDKNSWLYFTKEVFDLLYPSYGDTYPTFNGSVGMTYEQAGHGMAGRSIQMSNNKNLTLQDRIDHHSATSISTVQTTIKERESIISNFKKYFNQSVSNAGKKYEGYIVKSGTTSKEFKDLLEGNGINYSIISTDQSSSGYSYFDNRTANFKVQRGDIYIPSAQPKAVLLDVLMEEEPVLADSVTYDITSWCLPFAYGLKTYGVNTGFQIKENKQSTTKKRSTFPQNSYAIYFNWSEDMESKRVLGDLLNQNNLTIKRVNSVIEMKDAELTAGDIVILSGDQMDKSIYDNAIQIVSQLPESSYGFIQSGFALKGSDLGGSGLTKINAPKVLTFFGDRVNANAYGQVWNYFENVIEYPLSRVDLSRLGSIDLSEFNTIILPDGYYSLSENQRNSLREWLREGGKLITIGGANRSFRNDKNFAIGKVEKELKNKETDKEAELRYKKRKYEGAERRSIAGSIPGAIFKTEIDTSHPICFGMDSYYTLKNSSTEYPLLVDNSYNPIRIPNNYNSYGFIGSKIQDNFNNSAVVSVENMGGGQVVYMADNPLFRAFWKSGEVLFANVIFQL
jgi:hypothetical protein